MAKDPYQAGMFNADPYWKKCDITGRLVVVLDGRYENRELELITPPSRALLKGEIHELILTDETDAKPGKVVNKIAYLGFMEVLDAGVMVMGDEVRIGDKLIGHVAGFDITHMPNHLNIVLKAEKRETGREFDFDLNDLVLVKKSK